MSKKNTLEEILKEIRKRTGLTLVPEKDGELPEGAVDALASLLAGTPDQTVTEQTRWRALLFSEAEQDVEQACRSLHLSPDETCFPVLLAFDTTPSELSRALLAGLQETHRARRIEVETDLWLVLFGEVSRDGTEETAAQVAELFEAEAMQPVSLAYDEAAVTYRSLPGALKRLCAIYRAGKRLYPAEHVFSGRRLGTACLLQTVPPEEKQVFLARYFDGFDFGAIDSETRDVLEAMFANGLSATEAARQLYMHRNTLVYRLDRFAKKSGRDVRRFEDAFLVRIALILADVSQAG